MYFLAPHPALKQKHRITLCLKWRIITDYFFPSAFMTFGSHRATFHIYHSAHDNLLSQGMAGVTLSHQCTCYLLFKTLVDISCLVSQTEKKPTKTIVILYHLPRRQLSWVSSWLHSGTGEEIYLLDAVRFTQDTDSGFFGWLFNVLTFPVIPLAVAGGFLPLNCLKTKVQMGSGYSCATSIAVNLSSRANLDKKKKKKLLAQRTLIDYIDPSGDGASFKNFVSESCLLSRIPEVKTLGITG